MKKKAMKKLTLSKDTLRSLSTDHARKPNGVAAGSCLVSCIVECGNEYISLDTCEDPPTY